MTALTTHDTKRGEDVRARIGVLSQVPSLWARVRRRSGSDAIPSPDPMTGLFLWQNIFGVWPVDGAVTDDLRARLHAYAEKAIREAASTPRGTTPTPSSSTAVHAWIDAVHRRADRHRADDAGRPASTSTPAATASGQKLIAADRARRARRLPGHRTVGRQPGRPRQPPTGRLRRATRGAGGVERPQDAGGRRPRCGCAATKPDTFLAGGYTPLLADGPAAAAPGRLRARLRCA